MSETILKLGSLTIPTGAGRALTQTLTLIDNGELRRTVNGTLKDITRAQNRKFSSSIRGNDGSIMSTPALFGVWKGAILAVDCIASFLQAVNPASGTVTLIRPVVAGSISGVNSEGETISPDTVDGVDVTFLENVTLVKYRPVISMMITDILFEEDEYSARSGWTLDLEEV